MVRSLFGRNCCDREMRNVGRFLGECEWLLVQLLMQLTQARCSMSHANVNRGRGGNETGHITKDYFEGLCMATDPRQKLQRSTFTCLQKPRRQKGKMGREMRQFGVQIPTEGLDKLSHWSLH